MATEDLLLSIDGITESYKGSSETAVGPLQLYLISVSKAPNGEPLNEGNEDIYLHATLPSGKSIALSADTQVQRLSDTSFLIQANKLNDLTVTLELLNPKSERSKELVVEDADSLDTVLTQFCSLPHKDESNSLVLVDNKDGHEMGTLTGVKINLSPDIPEDKSPVEVVFDEKSDEVVVQAYKPHVIEYNKDDYILSAAHGFSTGLVFVSDKLSNGMDSAANWWVKNRPASEKPLVFKESTKTNIQRVNNMANTGAYYSRKAVVKVSDAAANLGARLVATGNTTGPKSGEQTDAAAVAASSGTIRRAPDSMLNRSLIAFSTVLDGLDTATQNLIKGATESTTRMVGHSYGSEAQGVASDFGRSLASCAMVYIDVRGIYRKTIVRGVGNGMLKGIVGHDKVVLAKQETATPPRHSDADVAPSSTLDRLQSFFQSHSAVQVQPSLAAAGTDLHDNKIQY